MIQQEMNQIITHQPKTQLKLENICLECTNIYGFMIPSNKHWLPGGRGKGLDDPASPFSHSTVLLLARPRVIHLVSDGRQRVFLLMFSVICFTSLMKSSCMPKRRKRSQQNIKPAHLSLTVFQT